MKKKNMLLFVILFSIIFSVYVSIKYFNRNRFVNISEEFSIEKNQVVRVANKEHTSIKLLSISLVNSDNDSKKLRYTLLINGKNYSFDEIPKSFMIYENGELKILEGDEDRLILEIIENN